MNEFIEKYQGVWGDTPKDLLKAYGFQGNLTKKLDASAGKDLNRELFYEIVLWKLNRFPQIDDALLTELGCIKAIKPKAHRESALILKKLLNVQGIGLPMASTILRFLNPETFQIIDDRVFRIVCPGKRKYRPKPISITDGYLDSSTEIYFSYLDQLHLIVSEKLPFFDADRILYQLDIELGNNIGDSPVEA